MKTIQERWLRYKQAVYPTGIADSQEAQLHQAWFAAAFEILNLTILEIAELPDGQAEAALKKLCDEALHTCQDRADGIKGHN